MKEKYSPSKYRQQLLSNESIKFFWSENEKIEHYKTCGLARKIPDELLHYSSDYNTEIAQCPECAMRAYIEAFAEDAWNHKKYTKEFKAMGIKYKTLRKMYLEYGFLTKYFSDGILLIRKEEYWKIQKVGSTKGSIKLLHNNYYYKDGKRIRTKGFHEQMKNRKPQNIGAVLNIILNYDYSKHFTNTKKLEPQATALHIRKNIRNTFFGRIYIWIGCKLNLLTDCTLK